MTNRKAWQIIPSFRPRSAAGPQPAARWRRLVRRLLAVAWVWLAALAVAPSAPVRAQQPAPAAVAAPTAGEGPRETSGPPAAEKDAIARRLAQVEQVIQTMRSQVPPRVPPADLVQELEFLRWLTLTYAEQASVGEQIRALTAEKANLESELDALRKFGLSQPPPYSFLLFDETQERLYSERQRCQALELEVEGARAIAAAVRDELDASEQARRRAAEQRETNRDSAATAALARASDLAQLTSLARRNALRLREAELEMRRLEQAVGELRVECLEEKIQRLRGSARFSPQDLDAKLAVLASLEAEFRSELAAIQTRLGETSQRWLQAKQALDARAGDTAAAAAADDWNAIRQSQEEQISLASQNLRDLAICRLCWRRRYELANGSVKPETVRSWNDEVRAFQERMQRSRQLLELRAQDHRGELLALRRTAHQGELAGGEPGRPEAAARIAEVDRVIRAYESRRIALDAGERLMARFEAELVGNAGSLSTAQWFAQHLQSLRDIWNYEITSVDDRPVTVAKACTGLTLIVLGILFARLASRQVRRRVVPRLGLDQGAAAALQTITFYAMLAASVFFAFELVHLPLTVFTFLGGAVAIGIGFGSQTVLSNFISGLILLVERPIRVGDLVDIEGLYGTVEDIGARSTRLRTGSNLEIIVPNSKFLESNVTNWTLSDTRIRLQVSVGVGYGSPTRSVEQLLKDAVRNHPQILPEPAPIVVFADFGDNALLFQLHFWIQMRTMMEGERIKSDVRHTIDELLRLHQINIAYPQRDIHLDVQSPVQVQVRRFPEAEADPHRGLRAA